MYYFIPRGSKFYATIALIKPLYRYSATGIILSTFFFAWFNLLYIKIENQIAFYQQQQIIMQKQIIAGTKAKSTLNSLKENLETLEQSFKVYQYKDLDEKSNLQLYLAFILQEAYTSGLSLNMCTVTQEKKKLWYHLYTLQLNIDGTIEEITQFLNKLKTSNNLIRWTTINLTKSQTKKFTVAGLLDCFLVPSN